MKAHIFKRDGSWWLDAKFDDGRMVFGKFDSWDAAWTALNRLGSGAKAMRAAA